MLLRLTEAGDVAVSVWCRPLKGVFLADLAEIVDCEVPHDQLIDVPWLHCERTYADRPATKTSRSLLETFSLYATPVDAWTPPIVPGSILAWAERFKAARGPFVLIHPNGDQVASEKDWPSDKTSLVVEAVARSARAPIVIGGDPPWSEPPFQRGMPGVLSLSDPVWEGEPNALKLFALIQQADMLIGCDSGPIHLAQWSQTPTLAIWTKHHPAHYCDPHGPIEHFFSPSVKTLGDDVYFRAHYTFTIDADPWKAAIERIESLCVKITPELPRDYRETAAPTKNDCVVIASTLRQNYLGITEGLPDRAGPVIRTDISRVFRGSPEKTLDISGRAGPTMRKVVLKGKNAVGDAVVMSAALESLHLAHPGKFLTDVQTCSDDIYLHNPRVTKLDRGSDVEVIDMDYSVNPGLSRPIHFMQEFCEVLGKKLGVEIPLLVNRPQIHFSDDEKRWAGRVEEVVGKDVPYAVFVAGGKIQWHSDGRKMNCFTTKIHDPSFWQEIVDRYLGVLTFVQIGERNADSYQPELKNVVDQVNQTPMRVLIRLARKAIVGLGPSTLLQHVCAGTETPYVLVDSAREPESWMSYPLQVSLVPHGRYRCTNGATCGKVAVEDCVLPWKHQNRTTTACIASITPADVVRTIDAMLANGAISKIPKNRG